MLPVAEIIIIQFSVLFTAVNFVDRIILRRMQCTPELCVESKRAHMTFEHVMQQN